MKVGDKVICIKDHFGKFTEFLKGERYEISDTLFYQTVYIVKCKKDTGLSFFINPPTGRLFSNYFISEKEYRKLKLEKLNEGR